MIDELQLLQRVAPLGPGAPKTGSPVRPPLGPSFQEVFRDAQETGPLKLSAHAKERLQSRKIELDGQDWKRINEGVAKAAAKGAKEALIVTEKAALVVAVKNRTVVTAVDPASMRDQVFTNIDSAVLV